jgi:hypothetical protein
MRKKILTLLTLALLLNAGSSFAEPLNDTAYANIIKEILLKNKVIGEEKQLTQVKIKYSIAGAADYIANYTGGNMERHDRKVTFNLDLENSHGQLRYYSCNLTVLVPSPGVYDGSQLSSCEFRGLELYNLKN